MTRKKPDIIIFKQTQQWFFNYTTERINFQQIIMIAICSIIQCIVFWNLLILIKNSGFQILISQQKSISYFLLPQQCNNSLLFQCWKEFCTNKINFSSLSFDNYCVKMEDLQLFPHPLIQTSIESTSQPQTEPLLTWLSGFDISYQIRC